MPPWIDVPQASGAQRATAAQARAAADVGERWFSIRNAADAEEAELLLYDAIGGWFGIYADEFVAQLKQVTAPNLRVRVNSPGGSVWEGIAVANALRAHPATVTVQVDGLAASIASVIAIAGDRLEMAPNSMLMIHEAATGCIGDSADMLKTAEVLDMVSQNIANAYAAKAGNDAAEWRAAMKAETWYLPDDAVKAGLADAALSAVPAGTAPVTPAPDEEEEDPEARMHAQFDLAAYGYAGPPKPERPKPGPPPVKAAADEPAAPIALTINIGDAVSKQVIEDLRRTVRAPEPIANQQVKVVIDGRDVSEHVAEVTPDVPAEPVGTGQDGAAPPAPEAPLAPEPAASIEPQSAEPVEPEPAAAAPSWADLMANLTKPKPNPWALAMQNLTASSSATES